LVAGIAVALYAQGAAASVTAPAMTRTVASVDVAEIQADGGSRDRIVSGLEHRYNAKVVRIIEVTVGGRLAYDIRLLSNDRVWTVRVDAETGRELSRDD
jgi:hypothetical protein